MTTQLYTHPACLEHDPGSHHPECPERLHSVLTGLDSSKFDSLVRLEAPEVELQEVKRVHESSYVEQLMATIPKDGRVKLDPDTAVSSSSGAAVLRAAGAVIAGTKAVIDKRARNAFCAVRPPGHHAESSKAMGFCLFNSAAVGAFYARSVFDLDKVAVIDFDVHHGNGTQNSFESDQGFFYGSSHQYPAYPGTGAATEKGIFNNICNVPLSPGSGSSEFRACYNEILLPALGRFKPELIILSAGFDGHERDPLADLSLKTDDYLWVTRKLLDVADKCCDGRVVSVLEGGYDQMALQESAQAHVQGLIER